MFEKLIPALGVIAGIIVSQIFNFFQKKADSKERFFYEVYPKRLEVYEDVVKELAVMGKNEGFFSNPSMKMADILKKVDDDIHILDVLRARLDLYGSPAARNIISMLRVEMGTLIKNIAASDYFGQTSVAFFNAVMDAHNTFLEFVRKEAGANLVDKKINKILEVFSSPKRNKKLQRESNGPIN
jgi:hypothetical protein